MERLTRRNDVIGYGYPDCEKCQSKDVCNGSSTCLTVLATRLADYEDLEEQGRLVVLPCKVGDTVYPINADPNYEAKIIGAGIDNGGVWMEWAQYCENVDDPLELWDEEIFYISDIGKTVFLTRAEAEAAMEGVSEDA